MTRPVASAFKGKPGSATSGNLQVCNRKSWKKTVEGVCAATVGGDGLRGVIFLCGGLGLSKGR